MIFVAVGTQKFQLNRLLKDLDELVESGVIQEPVFAQTGHCDYIPKHYGSVPFLSRDQFEQKIENCDLLITHSGVGTILSGVSRSKPVIVYPRLAKFAEHVDDHQLQIAQSFSQKHYVMVCTEQDHLADMIESSRNYSFAKYVSNRSRVVQTIQQFLNRIPEARNEKDPDHQYSRL